MDLEFQLQASLGDTYAIERELVAGGMARVFVATEVALGRSVVIKVLPPEMSSAVLSERFRREISLAAQLRHPHIIPLLAAGDAGGLLYYTMPFVEGETLRARLARGTNIPLGESIRLIREIAYALAYAHGQGVVHRDIKPENILIEHGHAVVADFGVAKALASAANASRSSHGSATSAGIAMGTPAYMAPEQAAADPSLDHRADLYALGVVAYEIISGAPPFKGSPHHVIVAHMVEQPASLRFHRPDLPPMLADLVLSLLAKNPDDRPQGAGEVVSTLDGLVLTGSVSNADSTLTRAPLSWPVNETATRERNTKSVAVLPFVNTSGDADNEHFSNGLTDELISALGQIHGLKVAARTSVFALSGKGLDARAIAQTLGVTNVIEGSARRAGTRLKVTAQLVGGAEGTVLWSQSFDRQLLDVFAVQEEIARAIVTALNVRLTTDEGSRLAARPTDDVEAYELYLKGRYSWNKRSREGIETALAYFQNATHRDPNFALAYAGMADAYVVMSNYSYMPSAHALEHAHTAADRALALDDSVAEAHASKAHVLTSRGFFEGSEAEFRRAIELNPSYVWAHHFYSLLLMMLNRAAEAAEQNRITLSLDPMSLPGNANRGIILCLEQKYAEARSQLLRALSFGTDLPLADYYLGAVEASDGHYAAALPHLERAHRTTPGFPGVKGALVFAYAGLGRTAESAAILTELRAARGDDRSRIQLGLAHAVMGDLDRSYAGLAEPTKWDIPTLIELRADPLLARFRADPRYPGLLASAGLQA